MGLRETLEAATPGPWRVMPFLASSRPAIVLPALIGWVSPHGAYSTNRADNELIALAPELAALVLDMGEALALVRDWAEEKGYAGDGPYIRRDGDTIERLLARLDQLGKETK